MSKLIELKPKDNSTRHLRNTASIDAIIELPTEGCRVYFTDGTNLDVTNTYTELRTVAENNTGD